MATRSNDECLSLIEIDLDSGFRRIAKLTHAEYGRHETAYPHPALREHRFEFVRTNARTGPKRTGQFRSGKQLAESIHHRTHAGPEIQYLFGLAVWVHQTCPLEMVVVRVIPLGPDDAMNRRAGNHHGDYRVQKSPLLLFIH